MDTNSEKQLDENSRLMQKVSDDDAEAFNCLYRKFSPVLRRFLTNWDGHYTSVDDLVQEAATLQRKIRNQRLNSKIEEALLAIYLDRPVPVRLRSG